MVVGNGDKGTDEVTDKFRSGSAVTGNDVQGSGLGGFYFWDCELGGDRSDVDGSRGFSSLYGQANYGRYISACCGQQVGITTSGINPEGGRDVDHQRIHSEVEGHHCIAHCQPTHI